MKRAGSDRKPTRVPVVVVIGSLDVGGAEMDLLRNLPRIDRQRFDVSVYAFRAPGALAEQMVVAGIPVYSPDAVGEGRPSDVSPPARTISGVDGSAGYGRRRFDRAVESLSAHVPKNAVSEALIRAPARLLLRIAGAIVGAVGGGLSRLRSYSAQVKAHAAIALPMARHIRTRRAAVVHTMLPDAYFYGTFATLLSGRLCVTMSRVGLNVYQEKYPFYKFFERRLLHRFVRVAVGNAKLVLEQLHDEGVRRRKLFLLYNGIEAQNFERKPGDRARARQALGIGADDLVITVIANLHPYKGHADLIEALGEIQDRLPMKWTVIAAGRDTLGQRQICEDLAKRLNIDAHLWFVGQRDDIPALLASSDLHIHPSHQEALPNSIIEAMAASLPVIATRVGGVPELIEDGVNGLLVDPHAPSELGQAILALASDAERRRAMGEHSAVKVRQQFTLERSVERYEQLYARVSGARSRRRPAAGTSHS
jgi:glycosyltransferase involved in cell wall biosynthesis